MLLWLNDTDHRVNKYDSVVLAGLQVLDSLDMLNGVSFGDTAVEEVRHVEGLVERRESKVIILILDLVT